jgi:exopolysaccharide biosynthesis polyprenyl glycosylphosphotransferase
VFSRQRRKRRFLFGLADIALTLIAFELAYRTRLALPLERVFFLAPPVQALLLGAAAVLWPLAGIGLRIYDRLEAESARVILRDTLRQCAAAGIALILIEYALRLDLSRPFLALFLLYTGLLLSLFRLNAQRLVGWFRRGFGEPYYVLIAGTGPRAQRLARLLERSEALGVRLLGFVVADPEEEPLPPALAARYPVHPLEAIPKLLDTQVIDEIIFVVDSRRLSELEDVLLLCDESGVQTRVAVDFFPHVNSEVYLDRLYQTPLLTFSAAPSDELRLMAKRIVDIVVSAVLLVLLAPLMLVIAVLIRLTSPGPAIFRQQRCGLNGRRFTLYKFRSMCENAEELKPRLAHLNEKKTAFKIANDPRVTPLGRLLRKFSLDELPQLWNVLKGDMSLVGPRPPVPEEVEQYERWQRRRLRMRPGLTCLWALEGRDQLEFDTWIRKDLEYIDNWSLGLDLNILMRTIPSVLTGKGAH